MQIPTKKLNNGFEIPVLGFGTWEMGGREMPIQDYDENKDIEAIRKIIELGGVRFDTAEKYANGYTEEILGKALKGYDRKKFFITTKVDLIHFKYDDLINACKKSLERLQMDYIDLYLLHFPNTEVPIEETMKALDYLKNQGLIKNIGVCNFGLNRLKDAQSKTKNKIVLNQVHYNLIFREPIIAGILEYCQKNDMFMEAWRPLQQGNLTKNGINIIDELCKKYNKKPSQIAINWLISQDNVITLTKSSNIEHIEDIFGSVGWNLSNEDVDLLKKDFPIKLDRSNAVQLK